MATAKSPATAWRPDAAALPVHRRAFVLGAAATLLARPALAQPVRYVFDQKTGTIEFTTRHMGLWSSTGRFTRFDAEVVLDSSDASRAAVEVTIDTGSIVLAWPGAEDLLRSPAYFDSARFPTAHFKGSTVGTGGFERFAIKGDLSLHGVTRPFEMQGQLVARHFVPSLGAEVAEFDASGGLSRSAFGMVADQLMTGDQVRIGVRVALQLAEAARAG
jgi:polyisoprenoid-binding protein YceI